MSAWSAELLPELKMTTKVSRNTVLNFKAFLELSGLSLRKISLEFDVSSYELSKGVEADFYRRMEKHFKLAEFELDQDPAIYKSKLDNLHKIKAQELQSFLGDGKYSYRYWNSRSFMAANQLTINDVSVALGVSSGSASHCFGERPILRISHNKARKFESAFSLPEFSFDQVAFANSQIKYKSLTTDRAISFLGPGVFLNRFLNIREYIDANKITEVERRGVHRLSRPDNMKTQLGDVPVSYITNRTARSFESHFGLMDGVLDERCAAFDYDDLPNVHLINIDALPFVHNVQATNRFVNMRRFMILHGITPPDVSRKLNILAKDASKSLSELPTEVIDDDLARRLEECFGIAMYGLDADHRLCEVLHSTLLHFELFRHESAGSDFSERASNDTVLNFKALLDIKGVTLSQISREFNISHERLTRGVTTVFYRKMERHFNLADGELDQDPSIYNNILNAKLIFRSDKSKFPINSGKFAIRYWNARQYIMLHKLSIKDVAVSMRITQSACLRLFGDRPVSRISKIQARKFESYFALPSLYLEQAVSSEFDASINSVFVTDGVIGFLGSGVYLNRYANINAYIYNNKLSAPDLYVISGLSSHATIKRRIGDSPLAFIDNETARSFEARFQLESGVLDERWDGCSIVADQLYAVETGNITFIDNEESVNRYVNCIRFMVDQGLSLAEFAQLIGISYDRATRFLSKNPKLEISTDMARNIEKRFGLSSMSLDNPECYPSGSVCLERKIP